MKKHLEYPDCSLYRYLVMTAKKYPDHTALNYFGNKLTFRRLIGEVGRTARALAAAGVKKGDSVSVCLPNIPQAVFCGLSHGFSPCIAILSRIVYDIIA